jgi:hypothetical protein
LKTRIIHFPWTDAASGKRRPALVIDDLPDQDLILCQIISRARIPMLSPFRWIAPILNAANSAIKAHSSATTFHS